MCGRTGQAIPPAAIERRWGVDVPTDYEPRYNVAPREPLAVIPNDESDTVAMPEWGLLPEWVDEPADWHYPINARAETVESGAFRDAFHERPCLVLSSGYYEWKGERGAKQPYRVCRTDREPFAMAGVSASWGENGRNRETVAVLTADANSVVAPIHDRMPLVLSEAEERAWLESDAGERRELLDPHGGEGFEAYPISTAINDPAAEGPDLVEPLDHEQGDLGTFGD
jgi:putative SOS response-associated peptidase YedK